MLVLSRHADESIFIGDIKVQVISIKGDTVKIGVEAPADVPVHREEIYEAIKRNKARQAGPQ